MKSDLQKDSVVKIVGYREVPHLKEENNRRISTFTNAPWSVNYPSVLTDIKWVIRKDRFAPIKHSCQSKKMSTDTAANWRGGRLKRSVVNKINSKVLFLGNVCSSFILHR